MLNPRLHETGRILIRMKIRPGRLRVHTRPAYPLKCSTRIHAIAWICPWSMDNPSTNFHENRCNTFWDILATDSQPAKQTNTGYKSVFCKRPLTWLNLLQVFLQQKKLPNEASRDHNDSESNASIKSWVEQISGRVKDTVRTFFGLVLSLLYTMKDQIIKKIFKKMF